MLTRVLYIAIFILWQHLTFSQSQSTTESGYLWEDLLGSTLYKWNITETEAIITEIPIQQALDGSRVIGLYFSASWCGPCKQFTPQLVRFYQNMNKKGKKFEIVWISRDHTAEEFVNYYQSMPWLAVAIQNIANISTPLATKYQLKGIPHLVILDGSDATCYTIDGRTKVLQDQYGLEFPWASRGLQQFIPKPMRKFISNMVSGAIESLAPRKVMETVGMKIKQYASIVLAKLVSSVKNKISDWIGSKRSSNNKISNKEVLVV